MFVCWEHVDVHQVFRLESKNVFWLRFNVANVNTNSSLYDFSKGLEGHINDDWLKQGLLATVSGYQVDTFWMFSSEQRNGENEIILWGQNGWGYSLYLMKK